MEARILHSYLSCYFVKSHTFLLHCFQHIIKIIPHLVSCITHHQGSIRKSCKISNTIEETCVSAITLLTMSGTRTRSASHKRDVARENIEKAVIQAKYSRHIQAVITAWRQSVDSHLAPPRRSAAVYYYSTDGSA
jgi:hypothetical protein